VEVALKGGLSFGNVSNKGLLPGSLEGRTGFAAGLGFVTSGVAGIGVEALFAQRGVKSDIPTDERKLDYVDVPVYLRLMVPTPGVRPFGYLGPQISFELRCKANDFDCPDGNRKKTTYAGIIGRIEIRWSARVLGRGAVCLRPQRSQARHADRPEQLQDALLHADGRIDVLVRLGRPELTVIDRKLRATARWNAVFKCGPRLVSLPLPVMSTNSEQLGG